MSGDTKQVYKDYGGPGKGCGTYALPSGIRALEIGFGTGSLLQALKEKGNRVSGVDVSESLVQAARDKGFTDVHHVDVSEETLPFPDDHFDSVFCYEVFEHLTNPHRMISEIRRVLCREGYLFFSVPHPTIDAGYGLSKHSTVYPGLLEKANLERFFMQMYFRIVDHREAEPDQFFLGLNYVFQNMKQADLPDIVEVIIQDVGIPALYEEVLTEERLDEEIQAELKKLLFFAGKGFETEFRPIAVSMVRFLLQEYSRYAPLFPPLTEMLMTHKEKDLLKFIFEFASRVSFPREIEAQMKNLRQEYEKTLM
jgi:ubiquinone/menaquinone biosynthesis C-methylase UbiE